MILPTSAFVQKAAPCATTRDDARQQPQQPAHCQPRNWQLACVVSSDLLFAVVHASAQSKEEIMACD